MWIACLAIMLAAFAVGCSGVGVQVPGDGELVVVGYDKSFDENFLPGGRSEGAAVREGVRFWNQLGANLRVADEVSPNAARGARHFHLNRDTFSWPGSATEGVTWPGCGSATIYPNSAKEQGNGSFEDLRSIVAHEIGHAIGLYHTATRGTMCADPDSAIWPAEYPSASDIAEYRRVWGRT